ncbi:MAG: LemA family protein [Candidatus Komeilibacteria bacterium]
MNTLIYIIIAVVVVLIFWLIALYNGLIRLKNRTDEAWSDIDVQLKRRYDLIPNLIETVKGYAQHEKETLENVIKARNSAMSAEGSKKAEAENALSETLKSIFALSENYPDLKANQNFLQLQDELSDTENKIQAARRFYNTNVRDFNTKIQTFPNNIIAGKLKFTSKEFFQADDVEKENIAVKF